MNNEFDIVVAGGGIAGMTAGMASARLGRKTLVLAGGVFGGHLLSIEKIDGFPGFPEGVAGYDLCPMTQGQAVEAGAELAMTDLAGLAHEEGNWRLATGAGDYLAGAVILATGTSLKELDVRGEKRLRGKGVSHCASCDAPLLRDRAVTVVGGGDSALQEALTLAEFASRVVILHRGDTLSAQAAYRERAEAHPKIEFRFDTVVREILGDDTVSGVSIVDGSGAAHELEADGVFIYVGLEPNTDFLDGQMRLAASGHIPADDQMRTELPGLFAAGTVRGGAPGRAVAASGDGTTAAVAADRYLADGVWRV